MWLGVLVTRAGFAWLCRLTVQAFRIQQVTSLVTAHSFHLSLCLGFHSE